MRRIEAVVGPAAVEYLNQIDGVVRTLASQFKVKYEDLPGRVAGVSLPFFHLLVLWPILGSTAYALFHHEHLESGSIARKLSESTALAP